MKVFHSLVVIIFALSALTSPAEAHPEASKAELAAFFGVTKERIHIECPQKSYELFSSDDAMELKICLNRADAHKRCEVSISGLKTSPIAHKLSFEINYSDPVPRKRWESILQIHSFPDKGEKWRCPPVSLEVEKGAFRMFNRWDDSEISNVHGYNCTEPGSSISSRQVLKSAKLTPGKWQTVEIRARLSHQDGALQTRIDGADSGILAGPNFFNDRRDPFLKFGIYKPAGWEEGHALSCVKYRNVKIVSGPD